MTDWLSDRLILESLGKRLAVWSAVFRVGLQGALLLLLGMTLSACSLSPEMRSAQHTFAQLFRGQQLPFTQEQLAAFPYAALLAQQDGSPQAMLILGKVVQNKLYWYSGQQEFLIMRHGRLLRTAGLTQNLTALVVNDGESAADPLANPAQLIQRLQQGEKVQWHGFVDWQDIDLFSVPVQAQLSYEGETQLPRWPGRTLWVVKEQFSVPLLAWQVDNWYWVDAASGRVLQSKQGFHPQQPALWLTELKPYAS